MFVFADILYSKCVVNEVIVMGVACPVCSSHATKDHVRKESFQTVKCLECGLIFTIGIAQEDLDKFYDNTYFNNPDSVIGYKDYIAEEHGHRESARRLLQKINRGFPLPGKKVLDVGCAAGFLLDEARKQYGCDVFGVEPSPGIHWHATETLGIDVHTCGLENAGFAPESFDVVFLVGTIEHLLNPRSVLSCIYELLKPGGIFALTTIDTKGLFPLYSIKPPEHIIYFSHQNLSILLRQCGYTDVKHAMLFGTYRAADLFHRLHEFSGLGIFRGLERCTDRFAGKVHWSIPTNEMLVVAQKPK